MKHDFTEPKLKIPYKIAAFAFPVPEEIFAVAQIEGKYVNSNHNKR